MPVTAPSREIAFTADDIKRFSAATGDRNPLHLNPRFAQLTPYGEPVVHGALGVLAALSLLGTATTRVAELRVGFHHPIRVGNRVQITTDPGADTLRLRSAGLIVCTVRYRLADEVIAGCVPCDGAPPVGVFGSGAEARMLDLDMIGALGAEEGSYEPDTAGIRAVLGDMTLPDHLVAMVAWSSFWTGMRTPGRDAILCGLHATFPSQIPAGPEIQYRTGAPDVRSQTGFVQVNATMAGRIQAEVTLESLLRRSASQATAASIAAHLRPGQHLAGRTTLVVGGSRGLGRALSLGFATQGARVLAAGREPEQHVSQMRAGLGNQGGRLHAVTADATDPVALREALPSDITRLDGLVLCSTPPLAPLPLHVDAGDVAAEYVNDSVRHCWAPVAACRDLLHAGAFIVIISSCAVTDPPAMWPHYVAAKGALESLALYFARNFPWRVVLARPPRLRTDLTNTPLGHSGAVTPEIVAAEIVTALHADAWGSDRNGGGAVSDPIYVC